MGVCALRLKHVGSMLGECTPSWAELEVVRGRVRGVGVSLTKTFPSLGVGGEREFLY